MASDSHPSHKIDPALAGPRPPATHRRRKGLVFSLAGAAALLLGIYLGGGVLIDGWRHVASQNWPVAPGIFEGAEWRGRHQSSSLNIAYRYRVDVIEHRGNRIAFIEGPEERHYVLSLQPGQSVEVRHHPVVHATAVLVPGSKSDTWRIIGLALVLGGIPLAISVLFLIGSWKVSQRPHDPSRPFSERFR